MIHKEYRWKAYDGIILYGQSWMPDEKPAAVINFVHGFKDHSNRFRRWAERLVENGYAVVAIDLRGHGYSEGRRGYARSFDDYLRDAGVLLSNSRKLFKNSVHVLYGHSLGGNIVANYLTGSNALPDAAIIASPWFRLTLPPSMFKMAMAHIIRILLPTLTLKSDIDVQYLSRDPKVVDDYIHDPQVHNLIRPKLFIEIEKNGEKASRSIYKINIPMLVMHGTSDNICSFRYTKSFVMNSGARTTFREWPGAYHELHNDIIEKEVFAFVNDWLNRISKGTLQ
jgi:acylglycerol lipase